MPRRCAISLDSLGEAPKVLLVDPVTTLPERRMAEVCGAPRVAVAC